MTNVSLDEVVFVWTWAFTGMRNSDRISLVDLWALDLRRPFELVLLSGLSVRAGAGSVRLEVLPTLVSSVKTLQGCAENLSGVAGVLRSVWVFVCPKA